MPCPDLRLRHRQYQELRRHSDSWFLAYAAERRMSPPTEPGTNARAAKGHLQPWTRHLFRPVPETFTPLPATDLCPGVLMAFLLDARESAQLLGVSLRSFRNIAKRPECPQPRELGPRTYRWVRAELEAFAAALPVASGQEPAALQAARARRTAAEPAPFGGELR